MRVENFLSRDKVWTLQDSRERKHKKSQSNTKTTLQHRGRDASRCLRSHPRLVALCYSTNLSTLT